MKPIGIGIISFAHGHAVTYCQRIAQDQAYHESARLVACWDDNQARGQEMAAKFGMSYSPHIEDLLNNPNIQAVIVTNETVHHPQMVIAAAEAGKHILCQKPLALTLDECDRIIATVERTGVKFMMAYQMRRDPSNLKIKELMDQGALGRISLLRRRHSIPVLLNPSFVNGPSKWHFDPAQNMGMFMDDASHATDFIHWTMGKPISVMAEIENTITNMAPDDTGIAIYRFASGAMAVLVNSSVTLAGENTTEIYGDQGVIIQNHDDAPSTNIPLPPSAIALKLYTKATNQWQDMGIPIPPNHGERIGAVPQAFIDCLIHDTEPDVTAHDGRVSVEMVLGAYESARTGQRVDFPLS